MGNAKINPAFDAFRVPVDSLILNSENVQTHEGQSVAVIAASLNEYGQQKPIIVNKERIVIAGNGTLEAAIALEWDEIAAVTTDLTAAEAQKAYAIADNKTAQFAEWNWSNLSNVLTEIDAAGLDIMPTGFTAEEVEKIITTGDEIIKPPKQNETDEITCPNCGHIFVL